MSDGQSIYLGVLSVALLAAIAFAYSAVKQVRALGDRVEHEKRLVINLTLVACTCILLSTGLPLMATLQEETGNWRLFLSLLSTAVTSTFMLGIVARQAASPPQA